MAKDHKETMACLTANLKSLTETMASTCALLQQSLQYSMHPVSVPCSPTSGPGTASSSNYNYRYSLYPRVLFPRHPSPASVYPPIPRYVSPSPTGHRQSADNQVNASSNKQQEDYTLSQDMLDN